MSVLELREVSKAYGDGAAKVQALRDVNLSVEAGAMVAVMGPSGSGKSTLLTIAGSLEEPTSGEVLVDGASLAWMPRSAKARLRRRTIGYVFQDFNLLPGLTAAENVALPLELDGMPGRRARAAGKRALDDLGLGERADRFPDQLSGGAVWSVTRPSRRNITRSAHEASCASWVTTTAAMPRLHASCSRRITSSAFSESRAPDGSSASSRRRSPTTARAIATR